MKKLVLALCMVATMPVIGENHVKEKALFGVVAGGAVLSILYWGEATVFDISNRGFVTSIKTSTLIPRIALDLGTIAACVTGWRNLNK